MKKILIPLLLSFLLFSCLTTDDAADEVVDNAIETIDEVITAEAVESTVESKESVEVVEEIETVVSVEPDKIMPTEEQVIDAVRAYDIETLSDLLADIEDVKTIVSDDVLLCHMAEEAMGMVAHKNELLALLVEKKAYILQVDKDEKSMTRYAHAMEMGGTERTNYMDEIIGEKFQKRIEALRADDLETIISMTEYFPVNAYLLRSAVEEKASTVAFWILERGISANAIVSRTGDSLLHLACNGKPYNHLFDDRLELVEALLDAGGDIDLENKKGDTPIGTLFMVPPGKNGSLNLLAKVLLDAGADVNTVTSKNLSLINHATKMRYDELVKLLLDEGTVIDKNTLEDMNLTPAVMAMFLEKGADPEAFADNVNTFSEPDSQFDFVKTLLERGASPSAFNLPDVRNNFNTLKYLIEQGADINAGTILQACIVDYKNNDVLDYLVEYGADLEKKFYKDMTALHFAVKYKKNEAAVYLIAQGVEVNPVDQKGMTPLDYCDSRNNSLMTALIDAGAKKASEL